MNMAYRPSYFSFGGIVSTDYNVKILSVNFLDAPAKVSNSVHIPGRNGNIEEEDGSYENFNLKIRCYCEGDPAVYLNELKDKLMSTSGYHELWLDGLPHEFREATIKSAWQVGSMDSNGGVLNIVFNCKPQRFLPEGKNPIKYIPSGTAVGTGTLMSYADVKEIFTSDIMKNRLVDTWYTRVTYSMPAHNSAKYFDIVMPCGNLCVGHTVDDAGATTPFVRITPDEGRTIRIKHPFANSSREVNFYLAAGLGQKIYYDGTLIYDDGATAINLINDTNHTAKPFAHIYNTSATYSTRWLRKAVYGINENCVVMNNSSSWSGENENLYIDSESETALISSLYNENDGNMVGNLSAGKYIYDMQFPVLEPGMNTVYIKGVDYVELTPRWWRL